MGVWPGLSVDCVCLVACEPCTASLRGCRKRPGNTRGHSGRRETVGSSAGILPAGKQGRKEIEETDLDRATT
ncbi:hypothetical protein K402DRAFT_397561 [Aulographum hederae CBS 113979]|uniref:Uncharacterized protein n=1 Tax=Aulographum hederae CBS 113979 TaxID=1176131 RepID=A0A6G1GNU2_9PEZI|nr:hypothetical protein K402DRAFT_397561 [Aulographum hederae CBS 113979]